jgi:DNA-directed RNA polymerase subunit M/transcription elongation factor TFIIS
MLLHQITCPKCGASLTSKAGVPEGRQLNCPKCQSRFTAEAPPVEAEIVEDEVDEAPRPSKKLTSAKRRSRDDEPKALRRREPADDDEEPDERPRKRKKNREAEKGTYQKLKGNVWVRVVTLTVLLAILAVLGYMLYQKIQRDNEARDINRQVEEGTTRQR